MQSCRGCSWLWPGGAGHESPQDELSVFVHAAKGPLRRETMMVSPCPSRLPPRHLHTSLLSGVWQSTPCP